MSIDRSRPKQWLRRFFNRQDGTLPGELAAAADRELAAIREWMLADIDALVEEAETLGRNLGDSPDAAKVRKLYRLANEIFGLAGTFGLPHLGKAAHSLCELLLGLTDARTWNSAAVRVHLDGIRSLSASAADQDAARDEIVDGLAQVVLHVTPTVGLTG
jgi:chemotaxis protein histidine kinase CheA